MSDQFSDPEWMKIGVAASLSRQYGEDQRHFLERLARWMEEVMPGEARVKRRGFFSGKKVERITLAVGDYLYGLRDAGSGPLEFTRARVVKGIALKTEEVSPETWLSELSQVLEKRAGTSRAAREALAKLVD